MMDMQKENLIDPDEQIPILSTRRHDPISRQQSPNVRIHDDIPTDFFFNGGGHVIYFVYSSDSTEIVCNPLCESTFT